ncbi:MAG: AAA family ATPase [Burkholderiaceae bacterium]
MIDGVAITNFRGHTHTAVEDLRPVNLVVGGNGTGKTAFLEAVYLCTGTSPELGMRIKVARGFQTYAMSNSNHGRHHFWDDLFNNYNQTTPISIVLSRDQHPLRSLVIERLGGTSPIQSMSGPVPVLPHVASEPGITFKYLASPLPLVVDATPTLGQNGRLTFAKAPDLTPLKCAFFSSYTQPTAEELADLYSSLSARGASYAINEAISAEYLFISGISIEMHLGTATVCASIVGSAHKIPLHNVSGGVTRFFAILLAVAANAGGIVLIDEIDSGVQYDKLQSLWRRVCDVATEYQTQVLATSHSLECVLAAGRVAKDRASDFRLVRLTRKQGQIGVA